MKKVMAVKGDSGNFAKEKVAKGSYKSAISKKAYEIIHIQHSVGKPSVSRKEITKAVRSVMAEDGLIKSS